MGPTSTARGIHIRQAEVSDLDRLAPLFDAYRRFYGQPPNLDLARRFLQERLDNHQSVVFLAEGDEGEAVGFVQLYPSFSSMRARPIFILNDLYVAEAARRRGIAGRLLAVAAELGRRSGAVRLTLCTDIDNRVAQSVYEQEGWARDQAFVTYHLALDGRAS